MLYFVPIIYVIPFFSLGPSIISSILPVRDHLFCKRCLYCLRSFLKAVCSSNNEGGETTTLESLTHSLCGTMYLLHPLYIGSLCVGVVRGRWDQKHGDIKSPTRLHHLHVQGIKPYCTLHFSCYTNIPYETILHFFIRDSYKRIKILSVLFFSYHES